MATRALRSLSQGYLIVVVPLYLLQIGFNAVSLGALFTAGAFASAILTLMVSIAADQVGRKPFLIVFPLLTSLAAITFISTHSFWVIVAASALGTLGRGGGAGGAGGGGPFYPAQQALLADLVAAEDRTKVFAAFSFTDTIAGSLGGLMAGIPDILVSHAGYSAIDSYRPLFYLTATLGVAMAATMIPVRETLKSRAPGTHRWALLSRESLNVVGRLALTNFVNGFGVGFFAPFIPYWFYRRFGVSSGTIGLLFAVVNLAATVPYVLAPALARRFGMVSAVVRIRVIGVVLLALLPLMPTFPLAAAVYFARMVLQRASIPLRQSFSMGVVSSRERSAAAGLSNLPSQLAASASPVLAGYIFESISLELPFELAAFLQLLNAILFFNLFRNIRPPEEKGRETKSTVSSDEAEPRTVDRQPTIDE